jgi:hypothetical protein
MPFCRADQPVPKLDTADSRSKCNNGTSTADSTSLKEAMEKRENKEPFPLSHGTATTIYMNRFTIFVALGF